MAAKAAAAAPGAAGSNYPIVKDAAAIQAAEDFHAAYEQWKKLDDQLDVLKAKVLEAMAGAPKAIFGKRIVSAKEYDVVEPTENVIITKAMIGQVIPGKSGRKGYWRIWVR